MMFAPSILQSGKQKSLERGQGYPGTKPRPGLCQGEFKEACKGERRSPCDSESFLFMFWDDLEPPMPTRGMRATFGETQDQLYQSSS